ncbi:helix-turn-helix domain-containing protein [Salmonella enterica]|nr:helix-turn-helix domain-containing protein [Salmonella enterica]
MQVVMKYLRRGCRNIIHIATECGYRNVSYFIAIFRRYYALSPYQYQRKIISGGRQKQG